jgi:hypothetical protein
LNAPALAALVASILIIELGALDPIECRELEVVSPMAGRLSPSPRNILVNYGDTNFQLSERLAIPPIFSVVFVQICSPIKFGDDSLKHGVESRLYGLREFRPYVLDYWPNILFLEFAVHEISHLSNNGVVVASIVEHGVYSRGIACPHYRGMTDSNPGAMRREINIIGNFGLSIRSIRGAIRCRDSQLAIANRASQIDNLADQNGCLDEGGDYGRNAYSNRPPLIRVVAIYLGSMFGGSLLGCWGALNLNNNRQRLGAALIGTGGLIVIWGSVAFVFGLGLPGS